MNVLNNLFWCLFIIITLPSGAIGKSKNRLTMIPRGGVALHATWTPPSGKVENRGGTHGDLDGLSPEAIQLLKEAAAKYTFQYSSSATRRDKALQHMRRYHGPPLNVVLLGAPASGKGTIASMLATAYRMANIGTGDLLRREVRSGSEVGASLASLIAICHETPNATSNANTTPKTSD